MDECPFREGDSVVLYARDSGGDNQELSTAQQEQAARKYCEENHLRLSRIYADKARSGRSETGRDEFARMIAYLSAGTDEAGVILWSYSRLSRDFDDAQYHVSNLRRKGYKVCSLEEVIPQGSIGKVVESLHFWMADEYRQALSRDVKRGLQFIATNYKGLPGGICPYGYRREQELVGVRRDGRQRTINKLAMVPEEAAKVRRAFAMRAEGRSFKEINDETGLYKTGSGYTALFKNEIYVGRLIRGEMVLDNFCEPILDLELWDKVQKINQEQKDRLNVLHPRRARSSYLLSGVLRCAVCGGAMNGRSFSHGKDGGYYSCNNSAKIVPSCKARKFIRREKLESIVLGRLGSYLTDAEKMRNLYRELCQIAREQEKDTSSSGYEDELKETESAIGRIAEAIANAGYSQALLIKLAELENKKSELARNLSTTRKSYSLKIEATEDEFVEHWRTVWEETEKAGDREKQLFLRSILERVEAVKEEGKISGRLILSDGKVLELGE